MVLLVPPINAARDWGRWGEEVPLLGGKSLGRGKLQDHKSGGDTPRWGATDLFPGDSEKENQSKLCKSGQKTEMRIYRLPGLALQTTPELSPSPKLHPDFLGQRFPTHQTDLYLILFYFML